jgi:hypothetical protein
MVIHSNYWPLACEATALSQRALILTTLKLLRSTQCCFLTTRCQTSWHLTRRGLAYAHCRADTPFYSNVPSFECVPCIHVQLLCPGVVLAESWSVCACRPPWSTLTGLYSGISQSIEMEGSVASNTAKQADKRLGKAIPNNQIVKDVRPLGEEGGTPRNFSILQCAFCLAGLASC